MQELCEHMGLRFSSKEIEAEYQSLKAAEVNHNFMINTFLVLTLATPFLIRYILIDDEKGIIITGIVIPFVLILWFLKKKLSRCPELISILPALIYLSGSMYQTWSEIKDISGDTAFLKGYYFAMLATAIASRLKNFYNILFFLVVVITERIILYRSDDRVFVYVLQIALDLIFLLFLYRKEINERADFKRSYDYRQELKQFQDLMANHLPQGILILDKALHTKHFANHSFLKICPIDEAISDIEPYLRLFSIEPNTLDNSLVEKHTKPTDPPVQMTNMLDIFTHFQTYPDLPIHFQTRFENLKEKLFDASLIKLTWDRHQAIGVFLNDITYQETIIGLKAADASKDKVVASVSHELRTPITIMMGLLNMIETKVIDPVYKRYCLLCKSNADLLFNIVNSILDLHQIRNGTLKLAPSKFKLEELLDHIVSLFEFITNEKGLYLKIDIAPGTPERINTDRNRLTQIFINLISNAVKFTFKGGIIIGARKDPIHPDEIIFSITDSGVGIKDEDQQRLFKMYGKLEDSKAVNTSGVGIGLAVSDSLTRTLNNRKNLQPSIHVESKIGVGTTFQFNISTDIEAGSKLVQESPNFRASMLAEIPEAHKRPLNLLAKQQLYEYVKPSWHNPTSLGQIILQADSSSPLKEPNSSRSWKDSQSGTTPGTKPLKRSNTVPEKEVWVLAVDDNPFNLLIIKQILEERKFKYITACNGQEGVNAFKEHLQAGGIWSFVLMDCQMPVMDGFEAAQAIKQYITDNKLKSVPIFALTANNAEEDVKRSYESGMNEHILKPLTISKLDTVVWKYHIA